MRIRAEIEVAPSVVNQLKALGFHVGRVASSEYHDGKCNVEVFCEDKEYPNLLKTAGITSGITSLV